MTCISRYNVYGHVIEHRHGPTAIYLPTAFMLPIKVPLNEIGMLTRVNANTRVLVEFIQPYHFTNCEDLGE